MRVARRIGLTRIHMEEDAGKSIHDAAVAGSDATHVDLNRAGVPLLEIVSEPDLRSPGRGGRLPAHAALDPALHRRLRRRHGEGPVPLRRQRLAAAQGARELGTRTELKNLNSFRFVEEALEAEIERQAEILDEGGCVRAGDARLRSETRRTRVLRVKENADDYRYFPDPDLVPLQISAEQIERVRAGLPELAEQKRARFERDYGLSAYDAGLLTQSRALADFFEAAVARLRPGQARGELDAARSAAGAGRAGARDRRGGDHAGGARRA